jgi:hypothetical protein
VARRFRACGRVFAGQAAADDGTWLAGSLSVADVAVL